MEASGGNIGARGCRRRRAGGVAWAIAAVVAAGVLLAIHASRTTFLLLALPIAFAAFGFLQAREQTCVVHAMLGTRETDSGVTRLDAADRPEVRRRAWRVAVRSVAVAVLVTAAVYVLAGSR